MPIPGESTYQEYRRLRREIGYDGDFAISEHVWNGCDADSQENMLQQFRPHAAAAVEHERVHGVPWG